MKNATWQEAEKERTDKNKLSAQELRIGNYIQDNNTNLLEVFGLHDETIYSIYPLNIKPKFETTTDPTKIQPIPLTEERLLRLDKLNEYLMVDKIGFVIFKNSYAYQFIFSDYPFMHQLQNLYFALTGKELTIK